MLYVVSGFGLVGCKRENPLFSLNNRQVAKDMLEATLHAEEKLRINLRGNSYVYCLEDSEKAQKEKIDCNKLYANIVKQLGKNVTYKNVRIEDISSADVQYYFLDDFVSMQFNQLPRP